MEQTTFDGVNFRADLLEAVTQHGITTRQIQRPDQAHTTTSLGHSIIKELEESLDHIFIRHDAINHQTILILDLWLIFLAYAMAGTKTVWTPGTIFRMPEPRATTNFEHTITALLCDHLGPVI